MRVSRKAGAARRPLSALSVITSLVLILSALLPGAIYAAPSPTGATIASDLADYNPGGTVTLTGYGWVPGEVVRIVTNDTLGQTWQRDVTVNADASGNVVDIFQLPNYFVSDYDVTASSPQSGTATTTFTDANPSANLDQCANDPAPSPNSDGCATAATDWVNGNLGASKSVYLEGDSIPYRLTFDSLSLTSHGVTIEWDTTKSGTHAIDYLTSFNQSVLDANPCLGVAGCNAGVFSTFTIPADPQVTGAGVTPMAGQFTLYGGTITGVSAYSYPDGAGFAGDKTARITITFTAAQANPVLAWGGHISTRLDWGNNGSAIAISGSPYHTRLIDLDGSGGNQDRSLSADAVIFPGTITIVKDATPNGATSFGFTASPAPLAAFALVDDGTSANTKVFSNITNFTTYSVSESAPPAGWGFDSVSCSVTTPNGGSSSVSGATVTINMAEGESYTCTYLNSLRTGSLKLSKSLAGGPGGYTGPFTINYDCDGTAYDGSMSVSAGSSQTVSGIPNGTQCTVSETLPTPPTGYSFGAPTFSPQATVTISAGATVEVTTNNTLTRDTGSLVLAKSLAGGPSGYTGPFTINYDCGAGYTGSVSVSAGSSQTVAGIPTGTSCAVSETLPAPPAGYSFGAPTFSPSATVTIPAGSGSSVTVTTNNTLTRDTGSLKISKTLSNPDGAGVPASYTVNYDCGTGFTGSVSVPAGGSQTVSGIPTGNTCSVTEVAPAAIPGYTWGAVTYTPSSVTISSKGGTFEIVVGNSITRDRGTLTVVKKVVNDNGGSATVSAFGLSTSAGSLTFDSGVANGTTTTYTSQAITVVTGGYTLKENDVYGYAEGSWSCSGAAGSVVTTFNNGSVQVGKGENVVCAITNNDQPGTIVIVKNALPLSGVFSFNTTGATSGPGTSWPASFTLTGSTSSDGHKKTFTVDAGSYSVTESTQLGWTLTGIGNPADSQTPYNCQVTGSGGSSGTGNVNTGTASITLKNGDTVTCTFENTGNGATRTQGFWATHVQLAQLAWDGGTGYGHTFPGVAASPGIGDKLLCGKTVDSVMATAQNDLMGGFWSDISKTSTGKKRSSLDQARMQLLQQMLAAELNASAFGSAPSGGTAKFGQWEAAYCGTDQNAIKNAQSQAAAFNSQGDSSTFTPGTSADSKTARNYAQVTRWDVLP